MAMLWTILTTSIVSAWTPLMLTNWLARIVFSKGRFLGSWWAL